MIPPQTTTPSPFDKAAKRQQQINQVDEPLVLHSSYISYIIRLKPKMMADIQQISSSWGGLRGRGGRGGGGGTSTWEETCCVVSNVHQTPQHESTWTAINQQQGLQRTMHRYPNRHASASSQFPQHHRERPIHMCKTTRDTYPISQPTHYL